MGDGDEGMKTIAAIHKMIFLAIVTLLIIFFAYFVTLTDINTEDTEINLFINRIIYSVNSLAYYDEDIDRSYLGRIDITKLNSTNLESTIDYSSDKQIAAKLTLRGKDPVYYNENLYKRLEPIAQSNLKRATNVEYKSREFWVSYVENNQLKSSPIKIEVVLGTT